LNWNPKGGDLASFKAGAASGGAVPAAPPAPEIPGGAPPPPPPPVDASIVISSSASGGTDASAAGEKKPGGMAAVFAALNKGEAITTGLKKVTSDMKTKNRKDEPALEVKGGHSAPAPKAEEPKKEVKKEPKLELRQGTWFCENFENTQVDMPEAQMKQNVYIFNCTNAVVNVKDKVKSIQVDKCTKTGIVFTSVVSAFELVNSKRMTIQIDEFCPSVTLDKSSGVQIILTAASVKSPPQVVTSNVTEVNLVVPGKTADADPIEMPLPEQYLTVFENGKLSTTPIKHSGA